MKYARSDGRVISVRPRSQSLTNGRVKATKHYTAGLIDWLAVWDATQDRCFYVPASELGAGMSEVRLRLAPAANAQLRGIRIAARYAASEVGGAYHPSYGAIAQLGERDACIVEVAGSIPAGSIWGARPRPGRKPVG